MNNKLSRFFMRYWSVVFVVFGTFWLWAPLLNRILSTKTTLISQYEASGQPYSWLFRLTDIVAGLILLGVISWSRRNNKLNTLEFWLMIIIGGSMIVDSVFVISCVSNSGQLCVEKTSPMFIVHATETVIASLAVFILTSWSAIKDKYLPSILFLLFQFSYVALVLSNLSTRFEFNTLTQFVYQILIILWLAQLINFRYGNLSKFNISAATGNKIRSFVALWAGLNGVFAIVLSLKHIDVGGILNSVYFAGDTAWLAQHGVIVGVMLLYISRHLYRGENRARQIFLFVAGMEILKYSIITPHPILLALYAVTFIIIFWAKDLFRYGTVRAKWQDRLDDVLVLILGVTAALAIAVIYLSRNGPQSSVLLLTIDNYSDYVFGATKVLHGNLLQSALLAHTITVLFASIVWFVVWSLFRPINSILSIVSPQEKSNVERLLALHSTSSEDYFKLWPNDKQYFWSGDGSAFIAYKISGSVAYALGDPIASTKHGATSVLNEFRDYCSSKRLRSCFILIEESKVKLYEDASYKPIKIGASAVVEIEQFETESRKSKWGRWQYNRAIRQGYEFHSSQPPHNHKLMRSLWSVSNDWLQVGGHREQTFALGYFDVSYLDKCTVHYVTDKDGQIIAFANQLPVFGDNNQTTIDLMRYTANADGSLPFLLFGIISSLYKNSKYTYFDLGFVPLAKVDSNIAKLAKSLGSNRFSAAGLEQFKGKFKPEWHNNYAAYDGDIADLAFIALNLERALEP